MDEDKEQNEIFNNNKDNEKQIIENKEIAFPEKKYSSDKNLLDVGEMKVETKMLLLRLREDNQSLSDYMDYNYDFFEMKKRNHFP